MTTDLAAAVAAALPAGRERILAAVSGGADSVAMLHALLRAAPDRVAAAHVNHRLRGAESDRDERFVRELCGRLGVRLFVRAVDVREKAALEKISVELAARDARYAALREMAREAGCGLIATAHTLSDNAETILINLMRGTGLRGLAGIPEQRDGIIRPMLAVSRDAVMAYCEQHGIDYVVDSSNLTDDYTRNRVRHAIMPEIKRISPAFEEVCARQSALLAADERLLSSLAAAELGRITQTGGGLPPRLDAKAFAALDEALRGRVARLYAQSVGCPGLEYAHVRAVASLAARGETGSAAALPGGFEAGVYYGGLYIYKRPPGEDMCMELRVSDLPRRVEHRATGVAVALSLCEKFEKVHNLFNTAAFSYDIISRTVYLRTRRPGDRYRPFGRGGTKSARRMLMDAKIPAFMRGRCYVLADEDGGVLWMRGFAPDESVAPAAGEPCVLLEISGP